jgi:hypothetical protein
MLDRVTDPKVTQIDANGPIFFGSRRPRIWLRRCRPEHRPIIKGYIYNRGSEAEAGALAQLEALYGGGPVAVE